MPSLLHASIGDYRLVDFLGAGGMGEVYRAIHTKIGRVVAIKVLSQVQQNAAMTERFLNEARIQSRLQHRHIAALYDFVDYKGQPCILMEYVDGYTLGERLHVAGGLPFAEALAIFQAVVEAICYMHSQHIVHRDIKPANIKVSTTGTVKLLDFGIAKADFSQHLTSTGHVLGTLQYLAPEHIQGKTAAMPSDVWSLGVLLYELVTGRLPFAAQNSGELLLHISQAKYVSPTIVRSDLPPALAALMARCLQKEPSRRPTAPTLLAEVQRLVQTGATSPPLAVARCRRAALGPTWGAFVRERWPLGLLVLTLGMVIGLGVYVMSDGVPARLPLQPERQTPTEFPTRLKLPIGDRPVSLGINVVEGKADVYRNGQLVGTTPYQFTGQPGERADFTFKLDGYYDRTEKGVEILKKDHSFDLRLDKVRGK